MKNSLVALALAVVSAAAAAQTTVVLENTYHGYRTSSDASMYSAIGVSQTTKYGMFDAYVQGVRAWGAGYTDRLNGFEVGAGQFYPVGKVTLNPRVAYGTMGNINGVSKTTTYMLYSLEATTRLDEKIGGYVSVSHRNGLNAQAIPASNRAQAGLDLSITDNVGLRLGGSIVKELGTTQFGASSMLFVSF